MNRAIIKFSSITHTMRAKDIIEANGGNAIIRKNANPKRGEGCGYTLAVSGGVEKYISLMNINKIRYSGIEYR